ncbi:hypothetical protein [Virgibacillus doumboii]|uniref:hypothetical protein n=1 Tax=Virgibacillus doumboii TaxID=2697503 RepID=UPI0013DF3395|nr:hypothetical protein [Virgibacillus doumboii]
MKRPLGVSLISYFYIFGAIILLYTVIFYDVNADPIGIADRFGVPSVPEQPMRILVAIFSMGMVYGYIRLKKWVFWLMITYSAFFGLVSLTLISNQHQQPFVGNLIWSIIVLAYTFYVRSSFFKTGEEQYAKH